MSSQQPGLTHQSTAAERLQPSSRNDYLSRDGLGAGPPPIQHDAVRSGRATGPDRSRHEHPAHPERFSITY
jgi:hypothetical protein